MGYGRDPTFQVDPPNAPTTAQRIAYGLLTPDNPLRVACDREGINANETAARLLRPSKALNAPRTIEWEKIGGDWKRLMEGSGPARAASSKKNIGNIRGDKKEQGTEDIPKGIEKHQDNKDVQARVEEVDGGQGMNRSIAGEEKESESEEAQTDMLDMQKLGEFLDDTRDMVQRRFEEVSGDEEKLRKARKAYPKIMEEIRERLAGKGDGEVDLKALLAMAGLGGAESGISKDDGEGTRREDGDDARPRKRDARL